MLAPAGYSKVVCDPAAPEVAGVMVKVDPEIEAMVVLPAIPGPESFIPGTKPEGSETVKVVSPEAAVATLPACEAAV